MQTNNDQPQVLCAQGVLAGRRKHGVDAFFDIPYAAGLGPARRFSLPLPPLAWEGVRDASAPGPVFPQMTSRLTPVMGTTAEFANQSEDAFGLNVWRSSSPDTGEKLPVLFWIHGGGWLTGGAALSWYHGDTLAKSGRVIVVGVNYRLGALGNLYLPGETSGSMALHDLLAALDWVHDNIAAFGGDRDSITLCGQSAGAWYTSALMASPAARGRFASAILLSLPGSLKPQQPHHAGSLARAYCRLLDVPAHTASLRELPVARLLQGQLLMAQAHSSFADIPETFLPLADASLPVDMLSAAASRSAGVPVLLGTLPDEMGAFLSHDRSAIGATETQVLDRFKGVFAEEGLREYERRRHARPGASTYDLLVELTSDEIFREPTRRFAGDLTRAGSRVFLYDFTWRSKAPLVGACHCIELPFVFDNFESWADAGMLRDLDLAGARELAQQVQHALLNFVERGDPNGEGVPPWPAYNEHEKPALVFGGVKGSIWQ